MMFWRRWLRWGVFFVLSLFFAVGYGACSPATTPPEETAKEASGEVTKETHLPDSGEPATKEEKIGPEVAPEVAPEEATAPEPSPEKVVDATEPSPPDEAVIERPVTPEVPQEPRILPEEPTTVPQPKPYSGGTCPTFVAGKNTFKSNGKDREFLLFVPQLLDNKNASLLFLWHGLGDNPQNFSRAFGAQQLSTTKKMIIVVPKGASGPQFPPSVTPAMINMMKNFFGAMFETWSFFGDPKPDLTLFDDLLACLDKQYDIDNKRVYTSGFSAGGLWATYLTMHRSLYLAASVIFSGGIMQKSMDLSKVGLGLSGTVQMVDIPYSMPQRRIPVLLAWGDKKDQVSMANFATFNFHTSTLAFRRELKKDRHFVVSCNHGGQHTVPSTAPAWGVAFLSAHILNQQPSPLSQGKLPATFPSYCKVTP